MERKSLNHALKQSYHLHLVRNWKDYEREIMNDFNLAFCLFCHD